MDYLSIIFAILLVDLLALISPGPNFALITSAAISRSRRHALWTACGLALGSLIWAGAAALGIAALFEALPLLGLILKGVGIAYLIYLGIKLLRSDGFTPYVHRANTDQRLSGFWQGFLVNMTNPKSATYYASVFAAFLTPDMPVWVMTVLVVAIAGLSLIWHVSLAIAISAPTLRDRFVAVSKYIDRVCGAFLVVLGLRLAWDSR